MSSKPNVLIIMSDEQRTDTLGCYGNHAAVTGHVDALAERGVRFDSCFTPYPLCCPARASIWTSLLPHRNHVIGNWLAIKPELSEGGYIRHFAEAGYNTIYTGKWHVPGTTPERLGFRRWAAIPAVLNGRDKGRYIEEYREYTKKLGYEIRDESTENLTDNDMNKWIQNPDIHCGASDIKLEHFLETWQTERFLEQLDSSSSDKPFFAVCSYNAPHFPMIVPEPFDRIVPADQVILPPNFCTGMDGKPQEVLGSEHCQSTKDLDENGWRKLLAHYWGFCSLVDSQVGKIVDWLKENNKFDNTIIIYTSDHGDMIGSHGFNTKSWEMLYDEILRVPMIMTGPGIPQGKSVDGFVSLMDIMPTLAEICGVEACNGVDGISFYDALQSEGSFNGRDHIFAESFMKCHSGNGQHIDPEKIDADMRTPNFAIRTQKEKYIFHWNDIDEFYCLEQDPYENVNISADPTVKEKIERFLLMIHSEVGKNSPGLAAALLQRFMEKEQMQKMK